MNCSSYFPHHFPFIYCFCPMCFRLPHISRFLCESSYCDWTGGIQVHVYWQKVRVEWWIRLLAYLFSNEMTVNPFPNKSWFSCVCSPSLLKTLREKEKLLVTSNFSLSHNVFYLLWRTFCHYHRVQNCRLQTLSVWESLKFVVWKRVNYVCPAVPVSICVQNTSFCQSAGGGGGY